MIRKWLAVGIILLFVGVTIAPAIAQNAGNQSSSRGNWLYVGGSGPGNYTSIRDAIDDALDGDTVFVYNGIYKECNIGIEKSIRLIGEDMNKTIIQTSNASILIIYGSGIQVQGFTLKNVDLNFTEAMNIVIQGDNITIIGNIICNSRFHDISIQEASNVTITRNIICNSRFTGVRMYKSANIVVSFNKILDNDQGLYFSEGKNISICNNLIFNNTVGITTGGNTDERIYNNTIYSNQQGLWIITDDVDIYSNNITKNGFGIKVDWSMAERIENNNIYSNDLNAAFTFYRISKLHYKGNYWGPLLSLWKIILGIDCLFYQDYGPSIFIPWLSIDFKPSHKSYNIPGMS